MDKQKKEQEGFFVLQSHWHYHLIILATGFLIFLFVPLFILKPEQSKQIFNNGREIQVVFDILILIGIFAAASSTVYWIFKLFKRREMAASLIRFLFCWVTLSGFLLPLTVNNGMFELLTSPIHKLNFALVSVFSIVLALLWGSKHWKTITVFMATFLVIAIVPTIPRALSLFEKQSGQTDQLRLSTENNLLMIGMDGVPGHILAGLFQESPELESEFKDFTFYNNVSSTSPATDASLMGVMYGNHDFTKWSDPPPIDWRELFFNNADKYNFVTGFKFNRYNNAGTKLSAGRYGVAEQRNELFEMYRNVAVRLFSKFGINSLDVMDEKYFPDRGGKFYATVKGFDSVVASLRADSDRPTVMYMHFSFTHWPTSMDENCVHRKTDKEWMANNQNKDGIVAGAKCAIDKYTGLLAKLKSLDVYQNSTVVLYSDHGKPALYYPESPSNLKINDNRAFGFDRYQPFLMIKPASVEKEVIEYSDRIIILDDLAQTTCYLMNSSRDCETMPGVNILDDNDTPPDSFFIHVAKNIDSRWFLLDHKAVQLSRKVPLEEAMRISDEIELTEPEDRKGQCYMWKTGNVPSSAKTCY